MAEQTELAALRQAVREAAKRLPADELLAYAKGLVDEYVDSVLGPPRLPKEA